MGLDKFMKGAFEKELAREVTMTKCAHCNSNNTIEIVVFQKYASNLAISFYPIGKRVVSICSHCKQYLELDEMSTELKEQANILKKNTKTPLWTYTGLIIVLGLIICIFLFSQHMKGQEPGLISSPVKGDIYDLKLDDGQYTVMKVLQVNKDTVIVAENRYSMTKAKDLYKLDKNNDTSFFIDDSYPLTTKEVLEMYNRGEIIGVDR